MVFAGVVTFLTVQGLPLLLSFLSVYLVAIWIMMGMQRRARQLFEENSGHQYQRVCDNIVDATSDGDVIDATSAFVSRRQYHA
jgi:Na+-transporting methylmalonyl-CoA/oxaloacetate decarboxylase gamma subunit